MVVKAQWLRRPVLPLLIVLAFSIASFCIAEKSKESDICFGELLCLNSTVIEGPFFERGGRKSGEVWTVCNNTPSLQSSKKLHWRGQARTQVSQRIPIPMTSSLTCRAWTNCWAVVGKWKYTTQLFWKLYWRDLLLLLWVITIRVSLSCVTQSS